MTQGNVREERSPGSKSMLGRSITRALDFAICMLGETGLGGAMHGIVGFPRPAAELRASIVLHRFLDLGARVHHERSILNDGFANGTTLQKQDLAFVVACLDGDISLRVDFESLGSRKGIRHFCGLKLTHVQSRALEEIEG